MKAIFVLGMPGCGKTSVSRELTEMFVAEERARGNQCPDVTMLEMSTLVTQWLMEQEGEARPSDLLATELGSATLYSLLWSRIACHAITIVSGVREAHLLIPPALREGSDTFILALDCDEAKRRQRYETRGHNLLSFSESEKRAQEMKLPELLRTIDTHVDVSTIQAREAAAICRMLCLSGKEG